MKNYSFVFSSTLSLSCWPWVPGSQNCPVTPNYEVNEKPIYVFRFVSDVFVVPFLGQVLEVGQI